MMVPADDQDEVEPVPPHPGYQQAASSVHYTTSCEHSLVLLRMSEIIEIINKIIIVTSSWLFILFYCELSSLSSLPLS